MNTRPLALLMLAGCTDHLLIGAVDLDRENGDEQDDVAWAAMDAGYAPRPTPVDASEQVTSWEAGDEPEVDAGPLEISLRIFGREDVTMAAASCGAACTDVEVIVQGGRPPYEVVWADGVRGPSRPMCPGINDFQLGEIVRVADSSLEPQSHALNPIVPLPGGCPPDVVEGASWQICIEPPVVDSVSCGPDTWYALRAPVQEQQVTISVSFTVPLFASVFAEVYTAGEPCGPQTFVASGDVNGFTPTLNFVTSTLEAPLRWLVLRAPRESLGVFPSTFLPSFGVCFTR